MAVIVQKYGGSSVADTEKVMGVARRVVATARQGNQVVVVVSAQGNTTDELIKQAKAISKNPPKREMDMLLATGEQVSIALLAMAIDALGQPVISLTGPQGGIMTDTQHTKARIRMVDGDRIKRELEQGQVVIVAGFQGRTQNGDITTLGRGGSDTTAVAVAAALDADLCEIYTDVDGVYSADPRLVPEARKLAEVDYGEMLELASLGAMILQPRAVEVAAIYGVTLHVRSSFYMDEGTKVKEVDSVEREITVTGVAADENCAKITLAGIPSDVNTLYHIFSALAQAGVNVDMIVQAAASKSTTHLSFTVTREDLAETLSTIERLQADEEWEVLADDNVAKVSIVGAGMMTNPGVAAKMFEALNEADVPVFVVSTSEIKVSCLVPRAFCAEAVRACHRKFELDTAK
ncbi:MAG TPA: aspartate kinase [Firmicutes bacterium]|nr:aspartate kinase [Bacillota bacterium]HHT42659.1 aspartate kinase [Bacillota bacterium]